MASWANPDEGLCAKCGHVNSRQWLLCDNCGARLPWAPPEADKLKPHEMTDEQLAAIYGQPPQREVFFLFKPENRLILRVVIGLGASLLMFILRWLL